jgi:hypothetical protein
MLKSKTMMNLLGIFVAAVVGWALLNLWYVPTLGKFSCSYTPWFVAEAQADADECPDSIKDAWNNTEWAVERFAEIRGGYLTTGLYYDESGQRHKILSGDPKGEDAQRAAKVLQVVGAPTAQDGSYPAARHVEVKIAAVMRESGASAGLVVINYEGGPCGPYEQGLSCQEVLGSVLAHGATLRVWYPDNGKLRYQDFTGR